MPHPKKILLLDPLLISIIILDITYSGKRVPFLRLQWQIVATCLLVVIVGWTVSYLVFDNLRLYNQLKINAQFYSQAKIQSDAIQHEFDKNLESLKALKSLFSASDTVTKAQFQVFTQEFINANPAIQALEWIPMVPASEREEFEKLARVDGAPNYTITERLVQGTMTPAGQRDIYYPVRFINPVEGNQNALGFDLGSNPRRKAAIEKAQFSRNIIASKVVSLVQETANQKAVLVFNPVYKTEKFTDSLNKSDFKYFTGLSLLVLRVKDVILTAITKSESLLAFTIQDREASEISDPIFVSNPTFSSSINKDLAYSSLISVADRSWEIMFHPTARFDKAMGTNSSLFVLISGMGLTLFTGGLAGAFLKQKADIQIKSETREQQLRQSKQRFSAAVKGSSAGLWEWQDTSKNEAYWSPQFYRLLGYQEDEVSPRMRTLLRWLHPEDRKKTLFQIKKLVQQGETFESDMRIRTKSGSYRWFKTTGIFTDNGSGAPHRLVGSIQDIHEGKMDHFDLVNSLTRINEINAAYEALVATAVDAIITIDNAGTIESFNPAAEYTFGYDKEEVIGHNVKMLMPASRAREHDGYLTHYLDTGIKHIIGIGREVIGKRKNGREFPLELSVGQMSSIKGGFVSILRDITERKKADQKTEARIRELLRSNKDLSQFADIASHDLKAPLRGIDHLAKWIEEKIGQHMDDESASFMTLLRARIHRLDTHLSSLLQYSKISDMGTMVEQLNLNELVQNIIDTLDTKDFTISVENLPTLEASSPQLTILFQNLIENAITHHDKTPGNILITGKEMPDYFELSVHDDGPGIPKDQIDKAFSLFQTLHPSEDMEGSGMGLAFVQKIIERNNATISVEKSNFPRGTAFVIHWPKQA